MKRVFLILLGVFILSTSVSAQMLVPLIINPIEEDQPFGNDNDINYGVLDDYGYLEELPPGETIRNSKTYSDRTIDYRIGIVNGGVLTIRGTTTLDENSHIRVCKGGTLIVDGGILQNADITMVPGSTLVIKNGGVINMASGKEFKALVGVIVNIERGEIN